MPQSWISTDDAPRGTAPRAAGAPASAAGARCGACGGPAGCSTPRRAGRRSPGREQPPPPAVEWGGNSGVNKTQRRRARRWWGSEMDSGESCDEVLYCYREGGAGPGCVSAPFGASVVEGTSRGLTSEKVGRCVFSASAEVPASPAPACRACAAAASPSVCFSASSARKL